MPTNGYQNYSAEPRPEAGAMPQAIGRTLAGGAPAVPAGPQSPVAGQSGPSEHSPESTRHALAHAVGSALSKGQRATVPGAFTNRQLRELGVPESELAIDRLSGLVEGDD